MKQQNCWAHLLRASQEEAARKSASSEMKLLHEKLKNMYCQLSTIIQTPLQRRQRIALYNQFLKEINLIINSNYHYDDAKRIQNRIKKQEANLITTLLYNNVALTNNLAERSIRPVVVKRKISGG